MKSVSITYLHKEFELFGEMDFENEKFNLNISNIKFTGYFMDGFKIINPNELDERFGVDAHGDLSDFTLLFSIPLLFKIKDVVQRKTLECELIVKKDKDNYSLPFLSCKLNLGEREIDIPNAGTIEGALKTINRKVPESVKPLNCFNCKFSDYSVYGQQFWASLLCFKNIKQEYTTIKGKDDYMEIMDSYDKMVAENHFCEDFEKRPVNHGYRG